MESARFRTWVVVVSLLCAASLWAQQADLVQQTSTSTDQAPVVKVPRLVRFGGGLKDLAAKPLAGPVDVHFSTYKQQTDAAPTWQETQTLQLDKQGRYTVLLRPAQTVKLTRTQQSLLDNGFLDRAMGA